MVTLFHRLDANFHTTGQQGVTLIADTELDVLQTPGLPIKHSSSLLPSIQLMMDKHPEDQPSKLLQRQLNRVSNTHRHLANTSAGTMQMNSA